MDALPQYRSAIHPGQSGSNAYPHGRAELQGLACTSRKARAPSELLNRIVEDHVSNQHPDNYNLTEGV